MGVSFSAPLAPRHLSPPPPAPHCHFNHCPSLSPNSKILVPPIVIRRATAATTDFKWICLQSSPRTRLAVMACSVDPRPLYCKPLTINICLCWCSPSSIHIIIDKHSRRNKLRNFSVGAGCIDWKVYLNCTKQNFLWMRTRGVISGPSRQTNNRNWGVGHMNWGVEPPNPPFLPAIPTLIIVRSIELLDLIT